MFILCCIGVQLQAATGKSFFMPRPQSVNLAMEHTVWHHFLHTQDLDDLKAHVQIAGFYQNSSDCDDVGNYFGIKNKHNVKMHMAVATTDVDFNWHRIRFIQNSTTDDSFTLTFEPEHMVYGVRFDYHHNFLNEFYVKAAFPIVRVENDMRMKVTDKRGIFASGGTNANDVENYFKGALNAINPNNSNNKLANLAYAKINGKQGATGIADVDLILGYNFCNELNYYFSLNVGVTVPTGNKSDGVWLFEPIVGNGFHWACGVGFDFGINLWEGDDQNFKLSVASNYRYLFENKQVRTLGLKNFGNGTSDNERNVHEFGHYRRLANGPVGSHLESNYFVVYPAANILTRNVDVEPGSQLDAIVSLSYINGGFVFDLGYNFFWKDTECVTLKDDIFTYDSVGNLVSVLHENYVLTGDVLAEQYMVAGRFLTVDDIDPCSAATPSQMTHKVYAGIGYVFNSGEYPVQLCLAGHYEFASDDGIENWGIWGKFGIGF
jgi:hypothetical protein